jgi:hypothetical protein
MYVVFYNHGVLLFTAKIYFKVFTVTEPAPIELEDYSEALLLLSAGCNKQPKDICTNPVVCGHRGCRTPR